MSNVWNGGLSRRDVLKAAAAAAGSSAGLTPSGASAQANTLNMYSWSAAVDLVKSHLTAFEADTGIKVAYSNAPWAQYREAMVTKFVAKAPIDVLWVSDSWLPEWAAGRLAGPHQRLSRAHEVQRGRRASSAPARCSTRASSTA